MNFIFLYILFYLYIFENNESNEKFLHNFYSSINNKSIHNNDDNESNESIHNNDDNGSIINEIISNNDDEPLDEELLMISNIWNNSNSNKNLLIRDILDKSISTDIMDDNSLDDDLKESLINDPFKHSMNVKFYKSLLITKDL